MSKPPKPRDHAPIHFWTPTINTTPITTIHQLHHLLNTDYPGIKRNPNYKTWLHDAETHLTLITHLKNQTHLQRGDRKRLGNELGIGRQKFTAWAQEARKPRLYYELERILSKTQAQKTITQLHKENNGLRSTEDVIDRLQTYYLTPLHEQTKQLPKRLHQCTLYFQALNLLQDGGAYLDVARQLKIHHSQVMHWLNGRRPNYIELTRHIPHTPPGRDLKWLPLNLERAFVPTDFIAVPEQITQYLQITNVLNQSQPLDNNAMHQWKQRFGPPNPEDAFYYLLGLIVSDYEKQRPRVSSTELTLNLSKNYTWSEQVGEAASYYFGQLGIHSEEGNPYDSSAGKGMCHKWRTQKSPLLTWIIRTCIGLQPHQRTTYHPIQADWIRTAPDDLRLAFLQGLSDGDGWADTKSQYIGIYAGPNISLIQDLLASFQIESTVDRKRVRFRRQKCIIIAAELPLFRFATSRKENSEKLAEMMKARKKKKERFIPEEISKLILELHNRKKSSGYIAEYIFNHFGISYDRSSISYHIRIFNKTEQPDQ